jgi:maltose-binding protein MalE
MVRLDLQGRHLAPGRWPPSRAILTSWPAKRLSRSKGPWLLPALQKSKVNWGVALHPYFEGGKPVTASGSWALSMNPFSQQKEAAAIFMKWMSVDNGGGYAINAPTPELPANVDSKDEYFARSVFRLRGG